MAYVRSKHLADLDAALQGIIANIQTGTSAAFPTTVREYCIAAGIFLAHAQFENFFVDLLDSLAKAYATGSAQNLPGRLRAFLFLKHSNLQSTISSRIAGGSEHEFLDRASASITGQAKNFIDQSLALPALTGDDIHGEQSYPSEKNIKRVLKRIGIGDPKSELNKVIQADAIALLESLASLRTALAHSGTLPAISSNDVLQRIQGLFTFSGCLDQAVYTQLTSTHNDALWHASLV